MAQTKATLVRTEPVNGTDYLGRFFFRPQNPIHHLHGQYVTLGLSDPRLKESVDSRFPNDIKIRGENQVVFRPYSIASAPEEELIELYIIRVDRDGRRGDGKGVLTTELFSDGSRRSECELTFLDKAKGAFVLPEHEPGSPDRDDAKTRIMVATGTGIAPYMSMLRSQSTEREGRLFVLIHGAPYRQDHAYREEIEAMQASGLNLVYLPIASREPTDSSQKYVEELFLQRLRGAEGRVVQEEVKQAIQSKERLRNTGIEEIIGHELRPETDIIMVCGNPGMIGNLELISRELGFKRKTGFKREDYW